MKIDFLYKVAIWSSTICFVRIFRGWNLFFTDTILFFLLGHSVFLAGTFFIIFKGRLFFVTGKKPCVILCWLNIIEPNHANHMIRCRNFLLAWFGMWFGFGVLCFYDSWFVIRNQNFLICDSDSWFGFIVKILKSRIRDSVTILFRIIWFGKWFGLTNTESYFLAWKDSV